MKRFGTYPFETGLVVTAVLLTVAGFWNVYFGPESSASSYHHLHILTNFLWLALLLVQLALIESANFRSHRKVGLSMVVAAPLLVASATLLSVESARKGLASGRGDFMIVQNVMGTFELALIIVLAFVLRKRRALHAAFLLSTALLFIGIALFFTLIGLVPGFKVEGPETFYRFGKALTTIQYACLAIGILFFVKDRKAGWPFLLVGAFFPLNELIKWLLTQQELIQPLTVIVGSASPTAAFIGSFCLVSLLLAATGILRAKPHRPTAPSAAGV
jgi:hypothetical protein